MNRRSRGFGLVEIMVALVLGLVVSIGITQIFVSARGTFASQNTAGRMQEDARFVLSKMTQELRMTGMYGCLGVGSYPTAATAPAVVRSTVTAMDNPILWDNTTKTLTIVTADIGGAGGTPAWTIVSNCQTTSELYQGAKAAGVGQTAFPLRQLVYSLSGTTLRVAAGTQAQAQPLLQNVESFDVSFGMAGSLSDPTLKYSSAITAGNAPGIRSVRIKLILTDPEGRAKKQEYSLVAHLRNRMM